MKKYLLVLAVMLLVVTGCGGKKLTCAMEEDGEASVVINFKNDKATKMTMTATSNYEEELSDEDLATAQSYASLICAFMDYEGVTCDVDITKKAMDMTITLDLSKMDDEALEAFGYSDSDLSYDSLKADLVDSGYSCK